MNIKINDSLKLKHFFLFSVSFNCVFDLFKRLTILINKLVCAGKEDKASPME